MDRHGRLEKDKKKRASLPRTKKGRKRKNVVRSDLYRKERTNDNRNGGSHRMREKRCAGLQAERGSTSSGPAWRRKREKDFRSVGYLAPEKAAHYGQPGAKQRRGVPSLCCGKKKGALTYHEGESLVRGGEGIHPAPLK